ncbi:MAG: glycosyltransferase family 2 protein, partial [Bifidobacteriaceae bacterium]|nr:glycosyltransferase family 2 protein [Bifidobacteriaceae bacterium]
MKKITILIPAYNEEEVLQPLFERLNSLTNSKEMKKYSWEYLFVNDGSRDNTVSIIKAEIEKENKSKNRKTSLIDLSRNFGKERAMAAGIDACNSDALIFIDADLQDPPELIPEMINLWNEGYDDVYAKRNSRAGESFVKKFTSKMYYNVIQSVSDIQIQKDTGDFRLLDKKCIDALKSVQEKTRN